jgi:predicted Zn-dependent protease
LRQTVLEKYFCKRSIDLFKRHWWNNQRCLNLILLAFIASLLIIVSESQKVNSYETPPLQVHPLPSTLAKWQAPIAVGDYFTEIKPTSVGYLIWSEFPIKIYIEHSTNINEPFQLWAKAVGKAVEEWNSYLPLVRVKELELADIIIWRSRPSLKAKINRETGLFDIAPARFAQTRYELYKKSIGVPRLFHRMIVQISPSQNPVAITAATRHELGHALGIWGHSSLPTDVMYFSKLSTSAFISPRDINTLKKIYQQSTRLGWTWPE